MTDVKDMDPERCESLKGMLLDIIAESEIRLAPGKLIRILMQSAAATRHEARQMIRHLADSGDLVYTNFFGSTYLEPSFFKPVLVADHYVLKPWDNPPALSSVPLGLSAGERCIVHNEPESRKVGSRETPFPKGVASRSPDVSTAELFGSQCKIEIVISPGIAFGSGSHPTTRLCLHAMAFLFFGGDTLDVGPGVPCRPGEAFYAADVGTGSGVLAVAAVKSGAGSCLAIDTDLNCLSEASANVALNGLEHQITVTDVPIDIDTYQNRFSLICANLRYPTLKKMSPIFSSCTKEKAFLILSGIRKWEAASLIACYRKQGFDCLWKKNEKKWTGMLLIKQ